MKLALENMIRSMFNAVGLDVRRRRASQGLRSTIAQSYAHIRDLGFRPQTVIDVGVASGTMELYENFPDAFFILVEPVKQFEPFMQSVLKKYRGVAIPAAAGPKSGEVTFNVRDNHPDSSSLYKVTDGLETGETAVTVPMVTLDGVYKEQGKGGPCLVKVDVQGAELDVLAGAAETLKQTEAVVLEVSLFQFMERQPLFYDVVHYMKERGFVAFDIVLGWNRPLDNALGQVDIVFVKEKGMFRKTQAYATAEQMKKLF